MTIQESQLDPACPLCGSAAFVDGNATSSRFGFWFTPIGRSYFKDLFAREMIRAKKCKACGHILLFGSPEVQTSETGD